MARIVEILVALNALGGIAVFLGVRSAWRRARRRAIRKRLDEQEGLAHEPGIRR